MSAGFRDVAAMGLRIVTEGKRVGKAKAANTADGYVVLNFFVPLRRGIRMPDGITFDGLTGPMGGVLTKAPPRIVPSNKPLPPLPHPDGAIQIRLIRDDAIHSDVERWDGVYPVALRALGQPEDGDASFAESFGTVVKTVAQLNVSSPCKLGSGASTVHAVEEGFGWALDCLRELLFRYRQAAHAYALVPARENLPPTVWMNRVAYYPDGRVFDDPGMGAYGPGGQGIEEMEEEVLSLDQMRSLMETAWDSYEDAIFQRFNTFNLDAYESLFLYGDYRAAVLNSATAAECFLDDILSYALWWEGLTPQEAAPLLSKPIYKRVKSEFPGRFGGIWLPSRRGAVLDWHQKVARYRDRIIHGGYQPTREEANGALEALSKLRKFVGKQVLSRKAIQDYKHLPLLLLGPDGANREGLDVSAMMDWYTDHANLGSRFDKWRSICRRLRIESFSGALDPELNKVPVFAVVTDQKIAHYAVDIPVATAAEIRIPHLRAEEQKLLVDAQQALSVDETHRTFPFVDMGLKTRLMISDKWYPAEDLLPGYEFMRPA
ncbi:hypothetical protein F8280_10980 [Micromonospora noduli]|uniref:hypothetical protein n=1 Tax=Micromonospora noduli TaxID=709876 RepID=UPI00124BBD11|nr:hypothetical protein [Micromonospora noduli]KAB1925792.1 hypothetical protein F8280_10980 [Micromonospora noduli]